MFRKCSIELIDQFAVAIYEKGRRGPDLITVGKRKLSFDVHFYNLYQSGLQISQPIQEGIDQRAYAASGRPELDNRYSRPFKYFFPKTRLSRVYGSHRKCEDMFALPAYRPLRQPLCRHTVKSPAGCASEIHRPFAHRHIIPDSPICLDIICRRDMIKLNTGL